MNAEEMFDKHDGEYRKFDRVENKLHPRPDVCAMLYLHEKCPGSDDAVCAAEHDVVYLAWNLEDLQLAEEDVVFLVRCGVFLDRQTDSLGMFV